MEFRLSCVAVCDTIPAIFITVLLVGLCTTLSFVVDLMLAMGYGGGQKDAGQATQYGNDGGTDGIIKEDKLGLDSIYLQAKRYCDNAVGRPDICSGIVNLAI